MLKTCESLLGNRPPAKLEHFNLLLRFFSSLTCCEIQGLLDLRAFISVSFSSVQGPGTNFSNITLQSHDLKHYYSLEGFKNLDAQAAVQTINIGISADGTHAKIFSKSSQVLPVCSQIWDSLLWLQSYEVRKWANKSCVLPPLKGLISTLGFDLSLSYPAALKGIKSSLDLPLKCYWPKAIPSRHMLYLLLHLS